MKKSYMQYLIWSSIVYQLEKAGDTHTPYYNNAYAVMKSHEPSPTT
jgi:hypothetical protein